MIKFSNLIDSLIAALIAGTGMVVTMGMEQPEGAELSSVGGWTWLVVGAFTLGSFAQTWQRLRGSK